jgi:enoyl-CoA hydratase
MFETDRVDDVVVLRMAHGKANALDVELSNGLADRLEEIARRPPCGLVLTGTGTIFSAGVDLVKLAGGRAYIERLLPALDRAFEALFTTAVPTVAAVNGHAIAGGGILAAACDRRVMIEGGKARIGVPELRVGVPFPPLAVEILRSAVPPPRFEELLYLGRTYQADEAKAMGLVDELAAESSLIERAAHLAREMASTPASSFGLTKRIARQPCLDRARAAPLAHGDALLASWTSDDTLAAVRAYVHRTLRRS